MGGATCAYIPSSGQALNREPDDTHCSGTDAAQIGFVRERAKELNLLVAQERGSTLDAEDGGSGGQGHAPISKWSKSPERVVAANAWVAFEVARLVQTIEMNCEGVDEVTGAKRITFGSLFRIYENLTNSVAGISQRARKRNMITFEGEMLLQGRNNNTWVTVVQSGS
jgi:hypothetical protein